MAELLFEIFSEELPAKEQLSAAKLMYEKVIKRLQEIYDISHITGNYFVTPRRMGFMINDIQGFTPDFEEEIRGPKITANERAVEGFMNKYKVSDKTKLNLRGEYYFYCKKTKRQSSHIALKALLEEILQSFVWKKSMRWGNHQIRWIRPIHSILCIYEGSIIPVKFGHITAGNITFGHRFMSDNSIVIRDFNQYKQELLKNYVEIFPEKRTNMICKEVEKICNEKELEMIEDKELLEENIGLVEYPFVSVGNIDSKFMDLPEEVLITSLRYHQKYMMLRNKKGELAPYFIIISNIRPEDDFKSIINGNEKVLKARLDDAKFFFDLDTKTKLKEKVPDLKKLTYHSKIGTHYDKMLSVEKIAVKLAQQLNLSSEKIKRCCMLAKADLVTSMIREFPELQGIMGYHYALFDNEDLDIAIAIRDHYKPQGPHDALPKNILGTAIAIADKLDTLNQMFANNIKPTGSKDPFALRRAAIGIIRLVCANKLQLSLKELGIRPDVKEFILERIKFIDLEQNADYDFDSKYIVESLK